MIAKELRKLGYFHSEHNLLRRLQQIERKRRAPATDSADRSIYDRNAWWKAMLKELSLTKLEGPWIRKITRQYWETYEGASPPFKDAQATVERLKKAGYRLALVSDSDGTFGGKRQRIQDLSFRRLFETAVVAGDDTPRLKPSRAPFLLVARRLNISPRECVYVGDNPATDVEGARAVGMMTILVKRRPYAIPRAGSLSPRPTFEVKALREIPRILAAR
jgi:HAD superfamily hydrolase (TIGR01662 family)